MCKLYYKIVFGQNSIQVENFQFRKGIYASYRQERGKLRIGDNVFFNNYCTICVWRELTIGDGTIFGENVKIYDHNHIYSDPDMPIKQQGYTSAPIHIGKHCWIGSNVTILKGSDNWGQLCYWCWMCSL